MSDTDGMAALRQANPRHDSAFDAAVAASAAHTRAVLAAEVAGAGVAVTGGLLTGHRRWFLALLLGGLALVATTAVVISRPTTHTAADHRPSVAPGPTSVTQTSVTPTTVTPTSVTPAGVAPTTVAPTTVAPTTVAPRSVPPTTGPTSSGAGKPAAGPVTTAPATTATPATVMSSAVPTCAAGMSSPGPPERQPVTVQDLGSGLKAITNVSISNGTVSIPRFAVGTRAAVVVVATKSDPTKGTRWSFDATDVAGHTTHCA